MSRTGIPSSEDTGQRYDVCIIGSGAAGGAAVKVLTEGGINTVMLEARPLLDPAKGFSRGRKMP